ncbi:MAG: anaerobic sulfatase maturase [Bacteroidales bacterium]|nr:anaerobic sulfatase maturase [Bacteroidales bacterium]
MNNTFTQTVFSKPIYVMAKPIGSRCNLACDYCYYLGTTPAKDGVIEDGLLEEYISTYIKAQPSKDVLFVWHGGEPLLAGLNFYKKVLKLQLKYGRGYRIDNVLQTNGVLLNDDWGRFFHDHNFLIGLSLDGPEFVHDRFRKTRNGKGSFAQVMKGLSFLIKHKVEFNLLSVIDSHGADYPLEIYNFLKSTGSKFFQFSPIVERDLKTGLMTEQSLTAIQFGDFYNSIFDEWKRKDIGEIFVRMFDDTLAGYMEVPRGMCTYEETCGHASVMERDGTIYACDHFVKPEFKIGNIKNSSITELMLSQKQINFGMDKKNLLPSQCKECPFLKLCNGGCPKDRIITSANGEAHLNYLCKGLRSYFAHTRDGMEFMANELRNKRSPMNLMNLFK